MKNNLKIINEKFKKETLHLLKSERNQLINHLNNYKEEYLKLNEIQRYIAVDKYVTGLSFYKDDEIIDVIKSLGLKKYTPRVLTCHLNFFNALDKFQEESKYLYPYKIIWGFYKLYSASVIKEKMALDFDFDLSAIAGSVNRQINNQSFPSILKEAVEFNKELFDSIKKEIPDYKIEISDKTPFSSLTHRIKYSHKNELYNLYMFSSGFNKKTKFRNFYEPDFKFEFYDLLEIVLREKYLLGDYQHIKDNYKTLRRFKIKRVERIILS